MSEVIMVGMKIKAKRSERVRRAATFLKAVNECPRVAAGRIHQEEKQAMAFALHTTQGGVILHGVSWTTYQQLLADRGLHSGVRFAFDQGTLEIMAPNFEHEGINRLLVQFVIAIALARNLDYLDAGSTTFDREDINRGF